MHFSWLFSSIAYFKACFEAHKIRLPFFSCRSLLLSTSILNDTSYNNCSALFLDIVISTCLRYLVLTWYHYTTNKDYKICNAQLFDYYIEYQIIYFCCIDNFLLL